MFCGVCGLKNDDSARYCASCGAQLSGSAPAPPVSSAVPAPADAPPIVDAPSVAVPAPAAPTVAAPETLVAGYRLAGMGDRLIAIILDSILLVAVYAVTGMAVAARMGGVTDNGFSLSGTPAILAMGATVIVGFFYFWLCEGSAGATLGKAIAGIQVRNKAGGPCGIMPSLIRNLLRIVDGLAVYLVGFLIAIFSKLRQRLGDHVAGTVVVANKVGVASRVVLVILWFVVIGGGLAGAYLIHKDAPELAAVSALPSTIPMTTTGRLKAGNFAFVVSNGGPERPSAPYKAGETIFLKYDVVGFARDQQGAPNLLFNLVALDPNGTPIHEAWKTQFNQPIARNTPVNGTLGLELPTFAPAGAYRIDIKVHDQVKNVDLELKPGFQVDAPAVAPPHGLEIRDFQLSLSREGPPESTPVLEGGGTLYMKCKVFGLQFQGDRVSAKMALKVIAPDGSVLLDKPDFVDLSASLYYHPAAFWMPVTGHLTIPSSLEKGTYTEQYTVVDNISNQTVTQEAKFELK